jgi:hypothetical protein
MVVTATIVPSCRSVSVASMRVATTGSPPYSALPIGPAADLRHEVGQGSSAHPAPLIVNIDCDRSAAYRVHVEPPGHRARIEFPDGSARQSGIQSDTGGFFAAGFDERAVTIRVEF